MSEHTGPYVPDAEYTYCPCDDVLGRVIVRIIGGDIPLELATKAAKTIRPHIQGRWVPVSERLPEFNCHLWDGFVFNNRKILAGAWARGLFMDGTITEWLDFTPPPLPGEEVGG